jgi:hypothetical protein
MKTFEEFAKKIWIASLVAMYGLFAAIIILIATETVVSKLVDMLLYVGLLLSSIVEEISYKINQK